MQTENPKSQNEFEVQEVINEDDQIPDIPTFFKGTTIFLTGVTGFLGHVLLAKLLSACPDIRKIYLLMREKRNRSINDRLQELLNEDVYENLRSEHPEIIEKLDVIKGDCLKPNLGMSEDDVKVLQQEVNVIFHVAATVKFDAALKEAVQINVRSTSDLLDIASNMKQLRAFIHVSTAYSFCPNRKTIEEKLYEPPLPAKNLINVVDNLDEATVNRIAPQLLDIFPNTYVFTKAVTEGLYELKTTSNLPVAIFRPTIVISTVSEPLPGWINNTYGPTGIIAASGLGLLRTMHADEKCIANLVPCDYVINALIASAWFTANRRKLVRKYVKQPNYDLFTEEVPVFNYSSTDGISWQEFCHDHELLEPKYPFSGSFWAYGLSLNKSRLMHRINAFFLHLIPAYIVDKILVLTGRKPKLLDAYRKINKLTDVISYFCTHEWKIENSHVKQLWSLLCDQDKPKFNFDLDTLNWKEYFRIHFVGIRENILKDKPETIPAALRKRKILLDAYRKINKLTDVISYFYTREWKIENSHVKQLWSLLCDQDKPKFNFDLDTLNWKEYFRIHFVGIRENILKDKPETIPAAV